MARYGKRVDMVVHGLEPFNAEPPPDGLAGRAITPLDAFYVRGHGPVPERGRPGWRVALGGLVERPLELGLDELDGAGLPAREVVATLQCAGNRRDGLVAVREIPGESPWAAGATGTARWRGVGLADVLALAGPRADTTHVAFVGADHCEEATPPQLYGASIPLAKALSAEVLLALEMNGAPLEPVHGGPIRVIVPGYLGARSVKWLTGIELRREPWGGYYQHVAYRLLAADETAGPGVGMELGEMPVTTAVLAPADGATVATGTVEISGYAYVGGGRGIARVDVSKDGGRRWRCATLLEDQGRWAWRLWRAAVELEPGEHEIVARAWDRSANTQPERAESVWNPKGYVNNSWARIRVTAA